MLKHAVEGGRLTLSSRATWPLGTWAAVFSMITWGCSLSNFVPLTLLAVGRLNQVDTLGLALMDPITLELHEGSRGG